MLKKRKTVHRMIGAGMAAAVLAFFASQTIYLPRYLLQTQTAEAPQPQDTICVMSANVRCFSPTDLGKHSWFYRAALVVRNIAAEAPDVIGFQEVTPLHNRYLRENLRGYDSVIAYRDNSPLREGCPVFYSTVRFDLQEKGSFWLSETPECSSKDWGAAFPRVCSYVILREKATGKRLVVFNTHLDHVSEEARIRGIGVVLDRLRAFGDLPCVLMGDLNAGEQSETYRSAVQLFDDAKYRVADPPKGPTYQNWGQRMDAENIDYFLISKSGVSVTDYRIVDSLYDGVYPSDHFPIVLHMSVE